MITGTYHTGLHNYHYETDLGLSPRLARVEVGQGGGDPPYPRMGVCICISNLIHPLAK